MITLCRSNDRQHDSGPGHEDWRTFGLRSQPSHLRNGFGVLESLDEHRFGPGMVAAGGAEPQGHAVETVTYLHEGTLTHEDTFGRIDVMHAGEFQRTASRPTTRHSSTNASRVACAHVFRIGLRDPQPELEPDQEKRRFSAAQRRGLLCLIASGDRAQEALHLRNPIRMYSAMLEPGQHVVHELPEGQRAWLHVVGGEATLGDITLTTGDGAGVTEERAVSVTARSQAELLLVSIAQPSGQPDSEAAPASERT